MNNKIKLGIIFPNNKIQIKDREEQFIDLRENLKDFSVEKYCFDENGKEKTIADFKLGNLDVILKNAHGREHEAEIEMFLDENKIPYLGSGPSATLNGTSKILFKKIFKKNNLPIADCLVIDKLKLASSFDSEIEKIENRINYPLLLKDEKGTESKGIFVIKNRNELIEKLKDLMEDTKKYIAEEFILDNTEVTVMLVGDGNPIAYEPVEIIKKGDFVSNDDKDNINLKLKVPAKISKEIIEKIKEISIKAHNALGCRTFSRVDILIKDKKLYIIDIDVHAGLRMISPTILSAEYKGENINDLFLKFYKLINK